METFLVFYFLLHMKRTKFPLDPLQVEMILNQLVKLKIITTGTRTRAEHSLLRSSYSSVTNNSIQKNTTKSFNLDPLITLEMFDAFWTLYPKKIDKGLARDRWNKICISKDKPEWITIEKALQEQKKSERWIQQPRFIPSAAAWLNKSRWIDDPKEMKPYEEFTKSNKLKEIFKDHVRYRLKDDGYYYGANGDRLLD
jgi:hypothetical protein